MSLGRGRGRKADTSSNEIKSRIVAVATRHFAKHGLQGASLKDIAQEADVANSLINYHFTDKVGLMKSVMEPFSKSRMEMIQRTLKAPENHEDMKVRLETFVVELMESVVQEPHGFEIMEREVKAENSEILEILDRTLMLAFKSVVQFFTDAKEKGIVRSDLEPLILAALLFTATSDTSRKQIIAQRFFNKSFKDPEWRKTVARHIVVLFVDGVLAKQN